jgi:prepilin-type N-terminal cleavage/methylation domain-containing protein
MKDTNDKQRESIARRLTRRLRNGSRVQAGFTLIELLIVIIIIAVLCTIAIPTFLGQRAHAQDTAAFSLVRNGLTALQGALVDTGDYTAITAADLETIEPSIHFVDSADDLVSTDPAWISEAVPAAARAHQVAYYAESASVADLACVSDSGNRYGIQIDTVEINDTGYVKVKVVEGSAAIGW